MPLWMIVGLVGGGAYYLYKKNQEEPEPRSLGPRQVGEIEVPPGADEAVIELQDIINLTEAWILQAAGDVAATGLGYPLPGAHPEHDWFGGELDYTGVIDPATRLHMTRIKQVVGKTHMPLAYYEQLGLVQLMQTDMAIESSPTLLIDTFAPLEQSLIAIGSHYPVVDDTNRPHWELYEAIGNGYYTVMRAAGLN